MIEVVIRPIRGVNERTLARVRGLADKIGDTTAANKEVSVWLFRWVNDNFRTEGGKVGGWPPFKYGGRLVRARNPSGRRNRLARSQSIVEGPGRRRYVDTSAKLLQDTGRLRASMSSFYSRSTAGIGSALPYSVTHDQGLPSRNVPKRRILPDESDRDVSEAVVKIYEAHVARALR